MALIKCHECQHDVASGAEACPHCGAITKETQATARIVTVGCLSITIAWFALWFYACS